MFTFLRGRGGNALAGAPARLLACVAVPLLLCLGTTAAQARHVGPSVQEVIEFTRIVHPRNGDPAQLQQLVSPDGRRVLVVTRQADVARDLNRYRFLMLDLDPERLATSPAPAPQVLATLEVQDDNDQAHPAVQDVRWADPRTLSFRLRPKGLAFQVYRMDAATGRMQPLTSAPLGVVTYALSSDLQRVVYASPHDNPPLAPGQVSVVVGNRSLWSVIHGQNDRRAQQRMYRVFVADSGRPRSARPLGEPAFEASRSAPVVDISPDGRWALVPRFETTRLQVWAQRYPLVDAAMTQHLSGLRVDPLGYFTRPAAYLPRRLVAYRLSDGLEQTVVDAPDDSLPGPGQNRADRLWMDGGRSVVLGGSHLPLSAVSEAGRLAGDAAAAHLIEYWPDTGVWKPIAALKGRLDELRRLPDVPAGFVAVEAGRARAFHRGRDGGWQEVPHVPTPAAALPKGGWGVRVVEGLDTPPDVVAEGPEGRLVPLTRLNPQVGPSWGHMRPFSWTDAQGRVWNGGLMVPQGFQAGRRHAVVIQTYGFSPDRYYLDGSNLVDGFTSGFAGRAFLREGILVVALPLRADNDWPAGDMPAFVATTEGVQALIRALVSDGLADPERVGILGWSATGERVLHTLAFSDAPLRAASIVDGDANTLFSYAVTYGASDTILGRKERTNEGLPYGDSLLTWLRHDPALHTDCIRAALRIESYGPWVKNNWDIHALLRRQYKPTEMVVFPGGSHGLLVPHQRMVSLQGNVDWHRFWLLGEQRAQVLLPGETKASLSAQYQRWEQMKTLQQADAARPACVRGRFGEG